MKLEHLREIPGILKISPESFEQNQLKSPATGESFPRGALSEVCAQTGRGRTQVFLSLLRENPSLRAAWIERELTFFPPHLLEQGLSLDQIFFVECKEHFFWALQEVLRSHLFDVIALEGSDVRFSEAELKRIQILSRRSHCAVLLLREEPLEKGHWMIRKRMIQKNLRAI
jgi:hypothetical protein